MLSNSIRYQNGLNSIKCTAIAGLLSMAGMAVLCTIVCVGKYIILKIVVPNKDATIEIGK